MTNKYVLLRDVGPWDRYKTITNDAENVLAFWTNNAAWMGRDLFYYDSEGELTEIVYNHETGAFMGFSIGLAAIVRMV